MLCPQNMATSTAVSTNLRTALSLCAAVLIVLTSAAGVDTAKQSTDIRNASRGQPNRQDTPNLALKMLDDVLKELRMSAPADVQDDPIVHMQSAQQQYQVVADTIDTQIAAWQHGDRDLTAYDTGRHKDISERVKRWRQDMQNVAADYRTVAVNAATVMSNDKLHCENMRAAWKVVQMSMKCGYGPNDKVVLEQHTSHAQSKLQATIADITQLYNRHQVIVKNTENMLAQANTLAEDANSQTQKARDDQMHLDHHRTAHEQRAQVLAEDSAMVGGVVALVGGTVAAAAAVVAAPLVLAGGAATALFGVLGGASLLGGAHDLQNKATALDEMANNAGQEAAYYITLTSLVQVKDRVTDAMQALDAKKQCYMDISNALGRLQRHVSSHGIYVAADEKEKALHFVSEIMNDLEQQIGRYEKFLSTPL